MSISYLSALISGYHGFKAFDIQYKLERGDQLTPALETTLVLQGMGHLAAVANAAAEVERFYTRKWVAATEIAQAVDRWWKGYGNWNDLSKLAYETFVLLSGKTSLAMELTHFWVDWTRSDPIKVEIALEARKTFTIEELRLLLNSKKITRSHNVTPRILDLLRARFKKGEIAHLKRIPKELQEDPILSEWSCAFSGQPIRFPTLIRILDKFCLCERSCFLFFSKRNAHAGGIEVIDPLHLLLEKQIHKRLKDIDQQVFAEENVAVPIEERLWWKQLSVKVAQFAIGCLEDADEFLRGLDRRIDCLKEAEVHPLVDMSKEIVSVAKIGVRVCLFGTAVAYKQVHQSVLALPQDELDPLLHRSSLACVRNLTGVQHDYKSPRKTSFYH